MAKEGVLISGAVIDHIFPLIYDAKNAEAGKSGVVFSRSSQENIAQAIVEKQISRIGVSVGFYDAEFASTLSGEFV